LYGVLPKNRPQSTHQLHIAAAKARVSTRPGSQKKGTIGEGVPRDVGLAWLRTLTAVVTQNPHDSALPFSTPAHRMAFVRKRTSAALRLGGTVLSLLRHGGASEDLLYANLAQSHKLYESMTAEARAYGSMSYRRLREHLGKGGTPIAPSGTPTTPEGVRTVVN
jgi:hypothetical protein